MVTDHTAYRYDGNKLLGMILNNFVLVYTNKYPVKHPYLKG